jgi:hypothetical protein
VNLVWRTVRNGEREKEVAVGGGDSAEDQKVLKFKYSSLLRSSQGQPTLSLVEAFAHKIFGFPPLYVYQLFIIILP